MQNSLAEPTSRLKTKLSRKHSVGSVRQREALQRRPADLGVTRVMAAALLRAQRDFHAVFALLVRLAAAHAHLRLAGAAVELGPVLERAHGAAKVDRLERIPRGWRGFSTRVRHDRIC